MGKKIRILFFTAVILLLSFTVGTRIAFAEGDDVAQYGSSMQKAIGYWLYDCYTNGDLIKNKISISDFSYVGNIFESNKGNDRKIRFFGSSKNGNMNETISCREQMLGFSRFSPKPLLKQFGVNVLTGPIGVIINSFSKESGQTVKGGLWEYDSQYFETTEEKKEALKKLGYVVDTSNGANDLISVSYKYYHGQQGTPGSGVIKNPIATIDPKNSKGDYEYYASDLNTKYIDVYLEKKYFKLVINGNEKSGGTSYWDKKFKYSDYSSKTTEELKNDMVSFLKETIPNKLLLGSCDNAGCMFAADISYITQQTAGDGQKYYSSGYDEDGAGFWYNIVTIDFSDLIKKGEYDTYVLDGSRDKAAKIAMQNLLGMNITTQEDAKNKVKFNQYEKVWLYQDVYLKEYYAATKSCGANVEALKQSAGNGTFKIVTDSDGQTCVIVPTQNEKKKVNGLDENGFFNKEVGFEEVAEGADVSKYDDWDPEKYNDTVDDNEPSIVTDPTGSDCYDADLNGQAWVICPTLSNLANAVVGIDNMIDGLLATDSSYYNRDSNTYIAWENFRNLTNVLLAVILIVIILSQLTGYGIDNYGIKKMLPKLIIMAILVNLSFFICQLAIDLSNILGNGLEGFFRETLNGTQNSFSAGDALANLVWTVFGALSAAGAVGSGIAGAITIASGGGVAVIISLFLGLLVALVSVLMFFVMIGARTIIVVLFTAISPVALALYILPNTQKYFKQWWKIFQTSLVIYPICGAVYGVSFLIGSVGNASNVTISGSTSVGDFAMALVIAIAPFLPFLILPTLLKGAMNTLGVVGSAINTIGSGLRKGISSGNKILQDTNAYKAGMNNSHRNINRWNAGLDRNGEEKKIGRVGKFMRGGNIGMAAARSQYISDKNKTGREESLMGDGFAAAIINQEKAADAERVKDFETLVNDKTRNGEDKAELYNLMEQYRKDENKAGCVAIARIAGRRKDTAVDFVDYMRKNAGSFSGELNKSIAKEVATGTNSGIYKSSSPLGFGWASAINKGETNPVNTSYEDWRKNNAQSAISTFVTDSKELGALKGSEQKELLGLMGTGVLNDETEAKVRTMATELIENRDKIPLDYSKAENIAALSGEYICKRDGNKVVFEKRGGTTASASTGQRSTNGAAAENQEFKVQGVGSALAPDQYTAPTRPQPKTPGQQMLENGQQWANKVAQDGGTTTTPNGIVLQEVVHNKPPKEKIVYDNNKGVNNGSGVM